MTTNVGQIEYVASIDFQQFVKDQRQIETRIDSLEGKASTFQGAMSKIGAAVTALFAAGAVKAALDKVVDAAAKYQSTLADLSAITGATGKDLSNLSDEAKNLAKTTTASAGDTVQAMKIIASAKPDLLSVQGALAAVTKEAITLAEASGMQLPEAANVVALALNQFKEGADQAARYVNVLAAGAKFGASEIAETGIALKNSGVSAQAAGVSFEEANAAIQALAATGIKGGEAGTALRNVLLKLENDADKTLKPSINGLAGALENLNTKNLSSTALTKLFGLENVNAAQALLGSADAVRTLTGQLTGTTTASEQAATNTNTYEAANKKLANALELVRIKLGDQLLPIFTSATDAIQKIAVEFVDGSERMTKAAAAFETAATVLAVAVTGRLVAGLVAAAGAAVTAAGAIGTARLAALAFSTVLGVLGGPVGIAVTALGLLVLNWDRVSGAARNAADISEESARRIAGALAKGGESANKELTTILKDAEAQLADSRKRQMTLKVGTYGAGTPEQLAKVAADVAAAEKSVADAKAAIASLTPKAADPATFNDRRSSPLETTPKKPTNDDPTKKKHEFDSEAYLYALRKQSQTELELVDSTEAEAQRIRLKRLKDGEISQAESEAAKTAIIAGAEAERSKIYEKNQDAALASAEAKRKEIEQAYLEQQSKDKAAADLVTQGQTLAKETIAGSDPVAALQLELETKSQILADAAMRDQANLELYAQARVALEQQTATKINEVLQSQAAAAAAINSQRLQDGAALFGGLADLTKTFAGEQSGAYKALFAVSKAFAIADAVIKIQSGIANALSLPWPLNLAAAASTASAAAGILSTIKGTSFGGGRLYGGDVSASKMYRVNENGRPEMYTAKTGEQYMLPNKNGKVTSARDLAAQGSQQGSQPTFNFGDVIVQPRVAQLPNGWFAIQPHELASSLQQARRDTFSPS